jgi:hypothetical protein
MYDWNKTINLSMHIVSVVYTLTIRSKTFQLQSFSSAAMPFCPKLKMPCLFSRMLPFTGGCYPAFSLQCPHLAATLFYTYIHVVIKTSPKDQVWIWGGGPDVFFLIVKNI